MPVKLFRVLLPLLLLLMFSQCDVLRDLTTEPSSQTTVRAPDATRNSSGRELQLRREVVDYAKKQLGTRYKYAGRTPRQGFDCSGFTHYVLSYFDVDLSTSSRAQEHEGRKIAVSEAQSGDLIFFRRSRNGAVFHVALVVSNDRSGLRVIHSTSRGVVIDNISTSSYWKPKISTARDVLGS